MAKRRVRRDSKGRFLKAGSVSRRKGPRRSNPANSSPRRRVYKRRRTRMAAAVANPRRRRSYPRRQRTYRRRYRRNPALFGLQFPSFQTVGYVVLGTVGTAYADGLLKSFLPATITANKLGSYATKIGSALGLGYVAGMFLGREARNKIMLGGMAYVALVAVQDFLPMISPGVIAAPAAGKYLGRVGSQPLLAEYPSFSGMRQSITAGTPSRLDPASRY